MVRQPLSIGKGRLEGVLVEFNLNWVREINGDDVEAAGGPRGYALAEEMGHDNEFLSLLSINRKFGGDNAAIRAGLNFYETEDVTFPSDKVQFATPP